MWLGKLQDMSDTLQENALYGQANALKLDSIARAIKVTTPPPPRGRSVIVTETRLHNIVPPPRRPPLPPPADPTIDTST